MPCELCRYNGEMLPFYPQLAIVKCPNCCLVFYNKKVETESLYTSAYFTGNEYLDYRADKSIIQRNFQQRIKLLRKIKPRGRLLEIGSAYGFFLELAQMYWEVKGVDITREGIDYARNQLGLNVILADFLDLPDEVESYDIICMWDTIEHLPQPAHFVEKASRWLKPGGFLLMTTGDVDSRMSRWQKENWRLIHPPTHLFYFSKNTLSQTVKQAGLQLFDISYIGYYRGLKFVLYSLLVLGNKKLSWLYRLLTLDGKVDFPIYLNLHDIMLFIATKPATTIESGNK